MWDLPGEDERIGAFRFELAMEASACLLDHARGMSPAVRQGGPDADYAVEALAGMAAEPHALVAKHAGLGLDAETLLGLEAFSFDPPELNDVLRSGIALAEVRHQGGDDAEALRRFREALAAVPDPQPDPLLAPPPPGVKRVTMPGFEHHLVP